MKAVIDQLLKDLKAAERRALFTVRAIKAGRGTVGHRRYLEGRQYTEWEKVAELTLAIDTLRKAAEREPVR